MENNCTEVLGGWIQRCPIQAKGYPKKKSELVWVMLLNIIIQQMSHVGCQAMHWERFADESQLPLQNASFGDDLAGYSEVTWEVYRPDPIRTSTTWPHRLSVSGLLGYSWLFELLRPDCWPQIPCSRYSPGQSMSFCELQVHSLLEGESFCNAD